MIYLSLDKAYNKLELDHAFHLAHFQHKTFTLCKHSNSVKFNRLILELTKRYFK